MTIEQAITKAITAGYLSEDIQGRKAKVKFQGDLFVIQAGNFEMTVPESMFFLDPLFWQSLGKALGWQMSAIQDEGGTVWGGWLEHWHDFIDALAKGKTAEQFFETLT